MSKDLDLTYFVKPSDSGYEDSGWALNSIRFLEARDTLYARVVEQQIKNFHELINKTLDEYFQFRYSVSNEQMMKVINNVNNFKLKHNNFQIISEQYRGNSYYYYREFLFMTVNDVDLTVTTHW